MVGRRQDFRAPVRLMAACLIVAAANGSALANVGQDTRIAVTCERTREVLKLPEGMTIADLRNGVDVPLERVRVCVEKPRTCSAEDERLALCVAG